MTPAWFLSPVQLRVYDVDTFDTVILAGHSEAILSVDASPDGQFIATASKDKTARYLCSVCACVCVCTYVCACIRVCVCVFSIALPLPL